MQDKKAIAAQCYQAGTAALAKQNWDYAVDMFGKCVSLVPDNLMYRQTLRGCQYRKYGDNKTGARMAGMKLMSLRGRIKKSKLKEDWIDADKAAEEGLALNPWDAPMNVEVAECCHKLGFTSVAKYAFQCAIETEPDNKDYNRAYAALLEELGEYDAAVKRWEHIYKLDPMDGNARSKVTQLGASAVMDRGGYENAGNTQDVRAKSAYDLDGPGKQKKPVIDGPGMSVEADLQRAIRKEPANRDNYLKLADYYKRENNLDKSFETLEKAVEVSNNDPNVRELLEDVELQRMDKAVVNAREKSRLSPDDEAAKKNYVTLNTEYRRREIEVLSHRVERNKQDSRLKFELGRCYMRVKKWREAIPLLQQAGADNRIEIDVLVALGECLINDGKEPMAKRNLERATEKLNQHDRPDLFKKAHYLVGRLYEKSGDLAKAEHHYGEVLSVDYDYLDTLGRLEKLQTGGGKA